MTKKDQVEIFIIELYSNPQKKGYETKTTIVEWMNETWFSDLMNMNDYKPANNCGYRYILVVIDKFSKNDWTVFLIEKYAQKNRSIFTN